MDQTLAINQWPRNLPWIIMGNERPLLLSLPRRLQPSGSAFKPDREDYRHTCSATIAALHMLWPQWWCCRTLQNPVNIGSAAVFHNPPDRPLSQLQQMVIHPEADQHHHWESQHLREDLCGSTKPQARPSIKLFAMADGVNMRTTAGLPLMND